MNPDRKDFVFILMEYNSHRGGFTNLRAWDYATTVQKLRENAAYMIGLGVDLNAMLYQYRD